jgi:hypothetical protein
MFLMRRRQQQKQQQQQEKKSQKEDISHLVGKPRVGAMLALRGKAVQYIALKNGEAVPPAPNGLYVICYDSVTEVVISAA